ncbi:hypothetical protein [Rickettsia endosymbiont of Culicoides newsteadi]|uniref:hypothetical protein n=1 Tax=Rickettsia endosymbiont of Culicoides newsteadi TaxID=1961830 RepID=UPI000B9B935A|nr:hypothetical protein [Rickettsia endosymbiont of Culicoides newsteadi]OZG31376.1 hypothetical protein RiCNE_12310 [Rickettsia endosymbiont of Culicoides newsteadi]
MKFLSPGSVVTSLCAATAVLRNVGTFPTTKQTSPSPYDYDLGNFSISSDYFLDNSSQNYGKKDISLNTIDDTPINLPKKTPTTTKALTTTKKPLTTTETLTTTEKASTTTEYLTTTEKASTTTEALTTTEKASTTTEYLTTTEKASTTTEALTTTEKASTTTEYLTTTEKASTTTEALTTTEKASTTTEETLTTTEKASTTTEETLTTTGKILITAASSLIIMTITVALYTLKKYFYNSPEEQVLDMKELDFFKIKDNVNDKDNTVDLMAETPIDGHLE